MGCSVKLSTAKPVGKAIITTIDRIAIITAVNIIAIITTNSVVYCEARRKRCSFHSGSNEAVRMHVVLHLVVQPVQAHCPINKYRCEQIW